jgi:alkylation response protein AidB-like acyl-CoA dehydrogenase
VDFSYSEEQRVLRELARKILEEQATQERIRDVEAGSERVDRELWRELAKANLIGACLPERFGGSGFGPFELCLLLEEAGRAVAPIPLWPTLALGALPLARFGSDTQQEAWLPGVVTGETFLSAALAEPGNDAPERPTTRAERDGRGFRLTGTKVCVPAAHVAARVLVPASTGGGGIVLAWVDPEAEGVTRELVEATNRERQARLTLEAVRVSEADVLAPDAGAAALDWVLAHAGAGLCALALGAAERALEITARYTAERQQFGRAIGSFQAVHQRAADAYIDVEAMRLTLWQAAFRLSRGERAERELAVAKFWASEAGHRVAYAAQHLHGGIGVDVDYPIHRYYLWMREIGLTLGSATPQLERLGRLLADA